MLSVKSGDFMFGHILLVVLLYSSGDEEVRWQALHLRRYGEVTN
jgi:hypothetical protein